MVATTNLLLSPEIQLTYNKKLLSRFLPKTVFNKFGEKKSIARHGGVAVNWRGMERVLPVAVASTSWPADATFTSAAARLLTEGTFYAPTAIYSWRSVTATVRQYGQAAYVSEWADAQSIDPQVPELVQSYSEELPIFLDLITRDVILAATNVQYANGRASQSAVISGDFFSLLEYRKALRTLKDANIPPPDGAGGRYPVIAHPDTVFDLQGDTNITNLWTYGGAGNRQGDIFDATIGDIPFGGRIYESTLAPVVRASGYTDYYNTFVVGKEAYGTADVESIPSKVIVHGPGSSGVSDPLDQVGTVGWKANAVAVMLNQASLVRVVHQASAFTGTRAGL